jgi:hypothetical protein
VIGRLYFFRKSESDFKSDYGFLVGAALAFEFAALVSAGLAFELAAWFALLLPALLLLTLAGVAAGVAATVGETAGLLALLLLATGASPQAERTRANEAAPTVAMAKFLIFI